MASCSPQKRREIIVLGRRYCIPNLRGCSSLDSSVALNKVACQAYLGPVVYVDEKDGSDRLLGTPWSKRKKYRCIS